MHISTFICSTFWKCYFQSPILSSPIRECENSEHLKLHILNLCPETSAQTWCLNVGSCYKLCENDHKIALLNVGN